MRFLRMNIRDKNDLHLVNQYFTSDRGWYFRGHLDANWNLLSTFERFFTNYKSTKSAGSIEKQIIAQFNCLNRRTPQYLPGDTDTLSKMSFLQHNGCSTRLLDITFDFYTSCFFALHDIGLSSNDSICCVWCFNPNIIKKFIVKRGHKDLYKDNSYEIKLKHADNLFENDDNVSNGILLIENLVDPDHQRLQKGGFLLALNKKVSTYRQLFELYNIDDDDLKKSPETIEEEYIEHYLNDNDVIQIMISGKERMVECEKFINMNCNKTLETLFKKGKNSELANLNSHIKCF